LSILCLSQIIFLSVKYIKPHCKVLELGGNIGRNSCVISKILNNSRNLVVVETDINNAIQLNENKILNNLDFQIEIAAISQVPLIQNAWLTKPKIKDEEGWKYINVISWSKLKNKYNIIFDTLVVDCEGALYYILKEEPNFLETFKLIIIENDFTDITHKHFVDNEFKKFNFKQIYKEKSIHGLCEYFYEVWKKF
jgi:FkbM family methyltransferase